MDAPPPPDNPVDTGRAVPAQRPVDAPYPRGPFTPPPPPAIFPPGSTPPASTPPGGFVPLQPSPPPPGLRGRRPRRKRNWRLIIAVLVGVVAALCASGSLVAYVAYDKATTPDRSTPSLAVRQYLQATFEEHDDQRARLFTCGDPKSLTNVQAVLTDLRSREQRFHITITVSWEEFSTTEHGKSATVALNLLIRVPEDNGTVSEAVERWDFDTSDRDGWRVCGAQRVS